MNDEARLTNGEAVPLLHALTARIAENAHIRVLAIKGPITAMQGLRAPRSSADIDLLLHPNDLHAFAELLRKVGWEDALTRSTPRLLPPHSLDLLNQYWPVGIDLHHRFPGFLAPPGDVFDALWERRQHYELAGTRVTAPDPVAHTALAALNLLRADPDGEGPSFADLAERAAKIIGPHEREQLVELVERTDAGAPLRPLLKRLGLSDQIATQSTHSEAWEAWELSVHLQPGQAWAEHLKSLPWWLWPREALKTLMLPSEEMTAYHAEQKVGTPLIKLRVRRMQRGLQQMPAIYRHLRGK